MPSRAAAALISAGVLLAPAGSAGAATKLSSNWAGYVVTPRLAATKFKTVSGSWVVPGGNCSRATTGASATWVGIGGYKRSDQKLEQTGTEFDCLPSGRVRYDAWYELVPAPSRTIAMTVRPGDTIDAAVTVKREHVTVYLNNRTRRTVFRRTFTLTSPGASSAEWIVEAPADCNAFGLCAQLPISDFGTQSFTHASATTARGTQGGIADMRWWSTSLTLNQGAQPSGVALDSGGFSVSRVFPQ